MDRKYPLVMPKQLEPFNGDHFIAEEFLELKKKFNINTAFETGTCLAGTTVFLSQAFDRVITIENNFEYLSLAQQRLRDNKCTNVKTIFGSTQDVMYDEILDNNITNECIFFNDAHFLSYCPLIDELRAIELAGIKPVIAIHDFKTDDPRMGFDSYNGQDFDLDWIRPRLDGIYGKDGWAHYYNTFERSTEVRRGIIFIHAI
jgi:hypothetical protein